MNEPHQEDPVEDHESPFSILEDLGALQSFSSEISSNLRFIVDKVWENARFFTTLSSALLTFSAAALAKGWLDKPASCIRNPLELVQPADSMRLAA
ncbi:MAG: hypothetical protein HC801_09820 [Nitrospira sp.]|nr:hypothetical protein [Nitrospira sp.]